MAIPSIEIVVVANALAIDPLKVALLQATNATFEGIDLETDYTDEVLTVYAIANEGYIFQIAPHGGFVDLEGVSHNIEFTRITSSRYQATIDMSEVPEEAGPNNMNWVSLYADAVMQTAILSDFGTLNVFLPTGDQMQSIASKRYLRISGTFLSDRVDLGEYISELNNLFISVPSSSNARLYLGQYDQKLSIPVADDYIVETSCGSVTVPETFHNAIDYRDVKIELFIPFKGVVQLDPEKVINRQIELVYRTNILTGDSIALVMNQGTILHSEKCQVGFKVPYKYNPSYYINELEINSEYMMGKTPYLLMWAPAEVTGGDFGIADTQTVTIGDLSGFAMFKRFDLSGIEATETELDEIFSQLERGVIINE